MRRSRCTYIRLAMWMHLEEHKKTNTMRILTILVVLFLAMLPLQSCRLTAE